MGVGIFYKYMFSILTENHKPYDIKGISEWYCLCIVWDNIFDIRLIGLGRIGINLKDRCFEYEN